MRTRLPAVLLLLAWLLPVTAHASGVAGHGVTPNAVVWQADQQHQVGRPLPLPHVRADAPEISGTPWHAVLTSNAPGRRFARHSLALPGDDQTLPALRRYAPPARAPPSTPL
ncbi:hypothetical protein Aph01nite_11450 [Acrocarpospora phusangensis]|uniref:Uncharacterized protein n=1 Tax=Acrocarpospora phusangensis TaxID=1070424 RepID=A0A919UNN0_9ACTN|nr:hypothetical protein [Acrocarpospora phusangensis]GIH22835.1 hypothetical protein Aph01nite_11450 [Acrocarpospora phusangensis]